MCDTNCSPSRYETNEPLTHLTSGATWLGLLAGLATSGDKLTHHVSVRRAKPARAIELCLSLKRSLS